MREQSLVKGAPGAPGLGGREERRFQHPARAMGDKLGYLYQINVSDGGIPKLPVPDARVTQDGLAGDRQRNRRVHGGVDRAVCLFSLEVIQALRAEGHTIAPGSSGENFTLAGVDWGRIQPGIVLQIGDSLCLAVTTYTVPCRFNAQWFTSGDYSRISQTIHPGWSRVYARVLREGIVKQGDRFSVELGTSQRGDARG